jgi:N-acetyl-gamma-glutamylphosphate reductase
MSKLWCSVVMVLDIEESSEEVFEKLADHGFSDKAVYEIWYWYHYDTANTKR